MNGTVGSSWRPALAGLVLWLVVVPVAVAEGYDEIVAMLEGGLSEATILDWLDGGEGHLARPSAEELIALKQAGASEDLLRELLRRSRQPASPVPGPTEPTPAPEAVPAGPQDARVLVRFRLLYAPRFDEDEESWDLLAYLDGQPLSFVPSGVDAFGLAAGEPLEMEIELPAGGHRLRVLQERHRQSRRGWRHAARAAVVAFDFELASGPPAEVEVEFRQSWAELTDPLTFRFTQGDRVADLLDVGGDPDSWPELCEDAGRQPTAGDCVGWASLWAAAPQRSEVLEALARFDFRPVPR